MNAKQRDSFETLTLAELRDATDEESGLRRLPSGPPPLPRRDAMPSLWREVVEGAPAEDPDPTYVSLLPPSPAEPVERVDLDALAEDLSKTSDALSAPRAGGLAAPVVAPVIAPRERRSPHLLAAAAVILAAYVTGVTTAPLWEAPAPATPAIVTPAIESHPSVEPEPARPVPAPARDVVPTTTLAPIVFAPSPLTSPPRTLTPAPDRAPAATRRAAPSRGEVRAAMAAVAPRVEACATDADAGRVARVEVTFGSHGRALHAVASGVSGPTASCIAAAARRARLSPFTRESFAVQYPFSL